MNIQDLGHGIFCIDTGLYRHGLAAAYLIREGQNLAFVDTGATRAVPILLEAIASLRCTPKQVHYIIPTHVHLDHAGGAGALMACCPNARLIVHPRGAPHLIAPERLTAGAMAVYGAAGFVRDYGLLTPVPETRVVLAEDGLELRMETRTFTILDTPGHANHHLCVFDDRTQGIFTGDTFGIAYRELASAAGPYLFAPATPVAFDPEVWLATIERLMTWQPQVMYLTHYGSLTQPAHYVPTLRASIQRLADLALSEAETTELKERPVRLRNRVAELLVNDALAQGCPLSQTAIRELLSLDADLNAQGLEVWLQRRAKALKR